MQSELLQATVLMMFPQLKEELADKVKEGYQLQSFTYEDNKKKDKLCLEVRLEKGYEKFVLHQSKNELVGEYSEVVFSLDTQSEYRDNIIR